MIVWVKKKKEIIEALRAMDEKRRKYYYHKIFAESMEG
jgi:hypothetical protein